MPWPATVTPSVGATGPSAPAGTAAAAPVTTTATASTRSALVKRIWGLLHRRHGRRELPGLLFNDEAIIWIRSGRGPDASLRRALVGPFCRIRPLLRYPQ